jgi:hypothetical protein
MSSYEEKYPNMEDYHSPYEKKHNKRKRDEFEQKLKELITKYEGIIDRLIFKKLVYGKDAHFWMEDFKTTADSATYDLKDELNKLEKEYDLKQTCGIYVK